MRTYLRKSSAQLGHVADEIGEIKVFAAETVPADPADFVVLAVGIVVAALRIADLVAGQNQRQALRQQKQASWFFRSWRRSAVIAGSSVGPSWPQLVL